MRLRAPAGQDGSVRAGVGGAWAALAAGCMRPSDRPTLYPLIHYDLEAGKMRASCACAPHERRCSA